MIINITRVSAIIVGMYFLVAFITLELDFRSWSENTRASFAFLAAGCSFMAVVVARPR